MNNKEFLSESKKYITDIYSQFQDYQDIVNSIFDYFHSVCKNNDIQYFLAFGSLLGLVRDGGNIPWDYDIDVVVPYEEINKLIDALEKDKNEQFYYVYKNNTVHYPTSCLRVCKKGYSYMAFHVDVFFLLGCTDDEVEHNRFYKKLSWLYHARQALNLEYHIRKGKEKTCRSIIRRVLKHIQYPLTQNQLDRMEESLYRKYPLRNANKCMIFYPLNITYSTSSFQEHRIVCCNGREVYIPANSDLFLRERYGDYKDYLPIKDRFNEFYKMFYVVEDRQNEYMKRGYE